MQNLRRSTKKVVKPWKASHLTILSNQTLCKLTGITEHYDASIKLNAQEAPQRSITPEFASLSRGITEVFDDKVAERAFASHQLPTDSVRVAAT